MTSTRGTRRSNSPWRRFGILLLALACTSVKLQASEIEMASHFGEALRAQQARKACVLVVVTLPGCPHCRLLKREQLNPLLAANLHTPPLRIIEIDLTSEQGLGVGQVLSQKQWAAEHQIRIAPTVIVMPAEGVPAPPALVGYASRDFYGSYLDRTIEAAQCASTVPPISPK